MGTCKPTHLAVLVEYSEPVPRQEHSGQAQAPADLLRVGPTPARAVHGVEGQELIAPALRVIRHL